MNHEELLNLLDEGRYSEFRNLINEMNEVDAAELFLMIDDSLLPQVFRLLKKDFASEIFAELDVEIQEKIIQSMSDREISKFIDKLFIDDTVDMLEELPASVVNRILKTASPELRSEINRFLNYPDDSVGSIMTSELIEIKQNLTVAEAVKRIRRTGANKETVYTIYVVDAGRILLGVVELKDLLFADEDELISDIMDTSVVSVQTLDDRENATNIISKYSLLALPVVDSENRLVGIVTVDDAIEVIQEEASEDIEMMAAILPTDKPYLKTGVFETWRKRIPWLLLLMLSSTFTGLIIAGYENALSRAVILTTFIPLLMGTGGNAGAQASVTIIQSLSSGEVRMGNILRILWKELRVSIVCGITLAVAVFIKAILIDRADLNVAFVVAVALLATIIFAKLVGASLPVLAKRINLDPAVMASPFITTIVDVFSLVIYFAVATSVLPLT